MKVILLQDVPKVGRRYEIKDVSDGYARNFLLAQKLARVATPETVKKIEEGKKSTEGVRKAWETEARKKINEAIDAGLSMNVKANEDGGLFSGIKKEEILKLIKDKTGLNFSPEDLLLDKPIKQTGEHDLEVKIGDKTVKLKLEVRPIK